jgi:hypothetical protein
MLLAMTARPQNYLLKSHALLYRARNEPDPAASWFETRGVAALLTMRVMFSPPPAKRREGWGVYRQEPLLR